MIDEPAKPDNKFGKLAEIAETPLIGIKILYIPVQHSPNDIVRVFSFAVKTKLPAMIFNLHPK